MLCQKCKIEMKNKEPWKNNYPKVYLCEKCSAFTVEHQNGQLEWHDEYGENISPAVITSTIENPLKAE